MSIQLRNFEKVFEWVHKVLDYFEPYKPDTKSMVINYRNMNSEINILLHIPENLKRKISKVEIPAYQGFVIADMMDESFNRIGNLWNFADGKWKLDPSTLPPSKKYLVILRGKIPEDILTRIVRVQPAVNRDQTEEFDRYWLDSMIRNVGLLEDMWQELSIEDIGVRVRVGIERSFLTTVPKELMNKLKATQRWVSAGHGRDKDEVTRAWGQLRRASREMKISVDTILDIMYKLTTGETFANYLNVATPYSLGEIKREERLIGLFPERMFVDARTELSIRQPIATGYLTFKKKEYTQEVEKSFSDLI
jgi:hypothetical protein